VKIIISLTQIFARLILDLFGMEHGFRKDKVTFHVQELFIF
jgi:hypothetical protein